MDKKEAKIEEETIPLNGRHTDTIPGKSQTILNKDEDVMSEQTIIHTN